MNPNQGPGEQGYPPPGGQGYPPPDYPPPNYPPPPGYTPPAYGGPPPGAVPPPAPAGINGLFQKWINVTTKPGVASVAAELPTANWRDIWLSIMGLAVLTIITSLITGLEFGAAANAVNLSGLSSDQQRVFSQFLQAASPSGGAAFGNIIGVPLGFFIVVVILFFVARIFGGTGTFLQQAYASALFYVPIRAVSAIVGLIPVLGGFVGFALGIYSIVLAVFAVAASQRLTTGRAVAVVLLPLAIGLVLLCGLIFIFVALLVAATHGH